MAKEILLASGRLIRLSNYPPKRIISLVPSLTETLFDLGLEEEVVGITRFCIHPRHWHQRKKRIGGTKDFRLADIKALQPDLIIANKEENTREGIEALAKDFPVWVSDISTIQEAIESIHTLGQLCGLEAKAMALASEISASWAQLPRFPLPLKSLYFIWKSPWMVAGKGTYIDAVLQQLGLENGCTESRYPVIDIDAFRGQTPDLLLFSSEPFPFKAPHWEEWQERFPKAQCMVVDGEAFSWYGSRMKASIVTLKTFVNQHRS